MKIRQAAGTTLWCLPIMATAIMLSSCTHPAAQPIQAPASPPPAAQLAQIGYGSQADFVQCVPPHCPVRTPKTLGAVPTTEPPSPTALAPAPQASPSAETIPPLESVPEPPRTIDVEPVVTEQLTWSVPFAFGSAQLGAKAQAVMRQVVEGLPGNARIAIAGRTDNNGPSAVNDALARARAEAVRDHLVRARPELAPAITVDAQGKCCFAVSNDTPAGRARNRRVDIAAEVPVSSP